MLAQAVSPGTAGQWAKASQCRLQSLPVSNIKCHAVDMYIVGGTLMRLSQLSVQLGEDGQDWQQWRLAVICAQSQRHHLHIGIYCPVAGRCGDLPPPRRPPLGAGRRKLREGEVCTAPSGRCSCLHLSLHVSAVALPRGTSASELDVMCRCTEASGGAIMMWLSSS